MGGKKTVGAHPTRGHYHNTNTTSRPHQVSDSVADIPFTQEFSLFCADIIGDNPAPVISSNSMPPPTRGDQLGAASHSAFLGNWFHTPVSAWGEERGSQAQLTDLESQIQVLRQSVQNLEVSIASEGTVAAAESHTAHPPSSKHSQEMKRLVELLKTVEGRQKSIQSKISHLDNVFGPSAAAWAHGTERLRFIMEYFEMIRCFPPPGDPSYGAAYGYQNFPHGPPYAPPMVGYNPYGGPLQPPTYTTYGSSMAMGPVAVTLYGSGREPYATQDTKEGMPGENSDHANENSGEGESSDNTADKGTESDDNGEVKGSTEKQGVLG